LMSTFPAAALSEADAVIERLGQVRVTSTDEAGLAVETT